MLICLVLILGFQSCKSEKKVYQSDCNSNIVFKHLRFKQLIDSIEQYDGQYVEVAGRYKEGKDQSALVSDSLFASHDNGHAIWINFSQDCPLYLIGTRQGLFEFNDGKFTQLNNKLITLRGKVDMRHKGHLGHYKGSLDRLSYIKI